MKKILTLFVVTLFISLSSCGKDNKTEETQNPLIGEWALQSQVETGKEFKEDCQEYRYLLFSEKNLENHRFRKNTNDVCEDNVGVTAYTVSGNNIIFEANGQKQTILFSIEGDILTITIGSVTQTYKKNARKVLP